MLFRRGGYRDGGVGAALGKLDFPSRVWSLGQSVGAFVVNFDDLGEKGVKHVIDSSAVEGRCFKDRKSSEFCPQSGFDFVHLSVGLIALVAAQHDDRLVKVPPLFGQLGVDLLGPITQGLEAVPVADVENEQDSMGITVEFVAHFGEDGRPGSVKDVDGELALVHVDLGGAVVDAYGWQVSLDETLFAVSLYYA